MGKLEQPAGRLVRHLCIIAIRRTVGNECVSKGSQRTWRRVVGRLVAVVLLRAATVNVVWCSLLAPLTAAAAKVSVLISLSLNLRLSTALGVDVQRVRQYVRLRFARPIETYCHCDGSCLYERLVASVV
jgi:hypothetical protein